MSRGGPLDIAIVGMACRFPGAADLFAYWEALLAGRDPAIGPDAIERADVAAAALADAGALVSERVAIYGSLPGGMPTSAWAWDGSPGSGALHAHEDVGMPPGTALAYATGALATREADLAIVAGQEVGSCAVVLRRRDDAERDGDRIYAVVREVFGGAPTGLDELIRSSLALYHRVRLPELHPPRPWVHADPAVPRRAEAGGLAVLEEHAASADAEPVAEVGHPGAMLRWETEAILLSAPDRSALADRVRELIGWLEDHRDAPLKDIAYTLNAPEPDGGARLGLVASSTADLMSRLSAMLPRLADPGCRAVGDGRGIYHWDEPLGGAGGLAFLFPGEGSQYPGMLADLCLHFPEVRRLFDTSDRIAGEQGDPVPPSEFLFGRGEAIDELWSASTAVNVVLSAQWALCQVLSRLGLRPDAVAGHSSGELLAMAAAGVLDADRHLERQLAGLGAIFRGLESAGDVPTARLVAVAAGRDRVEAACRAAGAEGVAVAIDNCPHQVVLAGPPAEVERVASRLRGEGALLEDLPFRRAYHTPAFAPVLGPVASFFDELDFRSPRIPIYSCATRGRMPSDPEAIRALAVAQWTRPVAFRETVEAMQADGLRIFVDVGARGNLAGFVQDTLRGRPAFAVAANLPRRSGLTQLNHLVAALFAQGVPIRPGFLYARRRPVRIEGLVGSPPGWEGETPAEPAVAMGAARQGPRPAGANEGRRPYREGGPPGEPSRPARQEPRPPDDPPFHGPGGTLAASIDRSLHPRLGSEPGPVPASSRFRFVDEEPMAPAPSEADAALLAFQETMRAFLETQQAVIAAYLGTPSAPLEEPDAISPDPEPGPWVGEVRRLVPGSEIESVYLLDARSDPIAEHHTLGGRRVSALDPARKGLPVLPFAVMAEMCAQAAALVVPPGLVLVKLLQSNAYKWVRYEDEPVVVEVRGCREPSPEPGEHRVRVALFNRGPGGRADAPRPVFEAVAAFAGSVPEPPAASPWSLDDPRPSRFTAESLYDEQWLFHGPAFQALVKVGEYSETGIDGTLRVLPWEPLLPRGRSARLHTDLIVLDSFTHLLGCWGLDFLADRGDVVFPLRMEELDVYGDRPAVGTEVACRIAIEEIQHHRVRVSAEIVRPDGTAWMRLRDWEDWRFHWPSRYRDVFRQPQAVFIGEEWPLDVPGLRAVWLAPPADMGRPVWRDVLEQAQLSPAERAAHLAMGGPEDIRSRRLWARIAAKEAARRLWRDEGRSPTYPADLAIVEERGRPVLTRVDDPDDRSLPAIAMADADGVAVAIAVRDPRARPGVAVASIGDRADEEARHTPGERAMLSRWAGPARAEWSARFRCAREAAARSAGAGIAAAEVVRADESDGTLQVRINAGIPRMLVASARRGESAWAWTLGEGADS